MTTITANKTYAALAQLSAPAQVIHKGEVVTVRPNWTGPTVVQIARMKQALKPHKDVGDEAEQEIIKSYGGNIPSTDPRFPEVVEKINAVHAIECDPGDIGSLPMSEIVSQQGLDANVIEVLLPYLK